MAKPSGRTGSPPSQIRGRALLLVLGLGIGLLLGELGLRAFFDLLVPPRFDVLHIQPDPDVGWKHVAGLEYEWTGMPGTRFSLGAREFSAPVRINAEGFRGPDRPRSKPRGTQRVALLGDSFVAALQVEEGQTAAELLQADLSGERAARDGHWEVLNFGVPGHSVGQSLLVHEHYARHYSPDWVFILVGYLQMERTVDPFTGYSVRVRPTYSRRGADLVLRQADHAAFLDEWEASRERSYAGGHRRRLYFNTASRDAFGTERSPAAWLPAQSYVFHLLWPRASRRADDRVPAELPEVLSVSGRVLSALAEAVRRDGARLVIVDFVGTLHADSSEISEGLERLCASLGIGYVSLDGPLAAARASGERTRFRTDGHFTAAGNRVFAEVLAGQLGSADAAAGSANEGVPSRIGVPPPGGP